MRWLALNAGVVAALVAVGAQVHAPALPSSGAGLPSLTRLATRRERLQAHGAALADRAAARAAVLESLATTHSQRGGPTTRHERALARTAAADRAAASGAHAATHWKVLTANPRAVSFFAPPRFERFASGRHVVKVCSPSPKGAIVAGSRLGGHIPTKVC
jgi:hypothetical protein